MQERPMQRFAVIASVYLLLSRGGEILLMRRTNTGYEDGKYGLIAGHLDAGEPLTHAAVREAFEEADIRIDPNDLVLKTTMHRQQDDRIDFFFEIKKWQGTPRNAEPRKCDDLRWFRLDQLPENTIPYIRQAIECWQRLIPYSEFGW
jgi:8-oxo-dGTP diphosphatase